MAEPAGGAPEIAHDEHKNYKNEAANLALQAKEARFLAAEERKKSALDSARDLLSSTRKRLNRRVDVGRTLFHYK